MEKFIFSHFGVPTTDRKNWTVYIKELGVTVTDPADEPFEIEWLKFDDDSPMHELIKTVPHVAYKVEDLDAAIVRQKVLLPIFVARPELRIAFIEYEGAVIELIEFKPENAKETD
jgi:hypothetical protein